MLVAYALSGEMLCMAVLSDRFWYLYAYDLKDAHPGHRTLSYQLQGAELNELSRSLLRPLSDLPACVVSGLVYIHMRSMLSPSY